MHIKNQSKVGTLLETRGMVVSNMDNKETLSKKQKQQLK